MNEREKIFHTMRNSGVAGIVVGIVTIVTGVTAGVVMIVSGARLLLRKNDVLI